MSNQTGNQTTVQTYEKSLDKYIAGTDPVIGERFKRRINEMLSLIPTKNTILELGTGLSRDADYIESQGYTVQRSDYPDSFIEYNRQQGKNILKIDALNLDITRQIDALFANAVLLHFDKEQVTKIITDIHTMLHEGGVFAFSLKRGSGQEFSEEKVGGSRFFQYWQPEEIEALLSQMGFRIINLSYTDDKRIRIIAKK